MIKIGDKVTFKPSSFADSATAPAPGKQIPVCQVTGRIEYINRAHRYFRVRFTVHGYTLYECFKF